MADNITLNSMSGGDTVALESISNVKYQKIKLIDSTVGSTTPIGTQANPIKAVLAGGIAGEDLVNQILVTENRYSYALATRSSLSTIKNSSGFIHSFTVFSASCPTMTLYDSTTGSGSVIAQTNENTPIQTYLLDETFSTGLTASFSIASGIVPRVNFSYR